MGPVRPGPVSVGRPPWATPADSGRASEKTIHRPSGDHAGSLPPVAFSVSKLVRWPPRHVNSYSMQPLPWSICDQGDYQGMHPDDAAWCLAHANKEDRGYILEQLATRISE